MRWKPTHTPPTNYYMRWKPTHTQPQTIIWDENQHTHNHKLLSEITTHKVHTHSLQHCRQSLLTGALNHQRRNTRTFCPTIANSRNKSVPSTRPLSPRTTSNMSDLAKSYTLEPSEAWHQNAAFHYSRNNSVPSPRPLPSGTTATLTDLAQSYLLEPQEWHQNVLTHDRRNNSVSLTVAAQNHLNCVYLAQSYVLVHDNSYSPRRHIELSQLTEEGIENTSNAPTEKRQQMQNQNYLI